MMMIVCMLLGLRLSSTTRSHLLLGGDFADAEKTIGAHVAVVADNLSVGPLLASGRGRFVVIVNASAHWGISRRGGCRESVTSWVLHVLLDQHVSLKTSGHRAQVPLVALHRHGNVLCVDLHGEEE